MDYKFSRLHEGITGRQAVGKGRIKYWVRKTWTISFLGFMKALLVGSWQVTSGVSFQRWCNIFSKDVWSSYARRLTIYKLYKKFDNIQTETIWDSTDFRNTTHWKWLIVIIHLPINKEQCRKLRRNAILNNYKLFMWKREVPNMDGTKIGIKGETLSKKM